MLAVVHRQRIRPTPVDLELRACVRRTNADVDALVADLVMRRPLEADTFADLRRRVIASCRGAILSLPGPPRDDAWRALCRGIAALLECAAAASVPDRVAVEVEAARSRLRALCAENEDLLS